MDYDYLKVEKKWQKAWEKEKVFEAVPNKKKKYFLTFPYPYVNLFMHIGHFFTLMRVESFARYKRLQGYNVLFPQGWHITGSPIINAAKRVKEKEPKQMKSLKEMNISSSEIKKFEKPEHWLKFFAPEWKKDYKRMGMSVDWRREFNTTSLNPHYDKFIRWQFRKLKEKGYVIKGKFPVVWDPKENVAVGDHARIEGEGETTQDFIWIKFRMKDSDLIMIGGTTRPDALYGQTNLWVDPEGEYVIVKVKDEKWVVGKETVDKIRNQFTEDV
jgi:leucyl-tRNA synthetase